MICGKVRPTAGRVTFGKVDITKKKEHQIAELGIGRKFQAPSIFPSMTVAENLEIAMRQKRTVFATLFAKMVEDERAKIDGQLVMIGLQKNRAGGQAVCRMERSSGSKLA